jgi:DNA-binding response OmpR family regulator
MNTTHKTDNESENDETVFIIDDEEEMVVLLEDCLNDHYTVKSDTNAVRALQRIDDSVDVILLDRIMPEMSGDELLGILREKGLDVQIAMVTGVKPSGEVMEMPFDDYLVKPVEEPEVLGLVDTLMTRKQYHRASQRFFRNISKMKALQRADHAETEEYDQLAEQTTDLREEINQILNDLDKSPSPSTE